MTPLSPGRFLLQLTLGQDAHDKLEQLRELLRHQNPRGDLASIVERAVAELLEREMKRRFAQSDGAERRTRTRARSKSGAKVENVVNVENTVGSKAKVVSRYIPRRVRREVYARDQGQCTFVSADGRRCASRGFLEVHHHETTFGRGGKATVENLRLACRSHNLLMAERDYGRGWMQEKLRSAAVRKARRRDAALEPKRESMGRGLHAAASFEPGSRKRTLPFRT